MSDPQRLFFALWPENQPRQAMVAASREALAASGGRAMSVANFHATLAFLGEVPAERVAALENLAQAVRVQAFTIQLDRIGTWRKAQTLVLGASRLPAPLTDLVEALRLALGSEGFPVDRRAFRFHVTLARKTKTDQRLELNPPIEWPVQDFVLVRSALKSEGSEYTVLRRWFLLSAGNPGSAGV